MTTSVGRGDSARTQLANTNWHEDLFAGFTLLKRWRRRLLSPLYRLPDTGFLGLTPLKTHVHVCGYSRAGTTMLQAMLEHAYPQARIFRREVAGWRAATWSWRNHELMISKMPIDIRILHRLQNFYRGRKAKLRIILMIRDPRDALTSRHVSHDRPYLQDAKIWHLDYVFLQHHLAHSETLLVRYEELTADPDAVQKQIEAFIGHAAEHPFHTFHTTTEESGFDTRALNGVRPIDQASIGRWQKPQHAGRIQQILHEVPEFPQYLIDLGYEPDTTWLNRLTTPATSERESS